jgi:hypothetical protein
MKSLAPYLAALLFAASSASGLAHPQVEHLIEAQKHQGESFLDAIYWLPETQKVFRRHLLDREQWLGFEPERWRSVPDATKSAMFSELGETLEALDGAKLDDTWKRILDWQSIRTQLALFVTAMDSDEAFLNLAFQDAALRSAFDAIIAKRPADFDTKHIGGTFTSGELVGFRAHLTAHILSMTATKRHECYSRIYGRIAAH